MIEDEGKSMRELIEQMQGPEENLLDVERKEEVLPVHGVLGVGVNALQIVSGEDLKRSCDLDTLERDRAGQVCLRGGAPCLAASALGEPARPDACARKMMGMGPKGRRLPIRACCVPWHSNSAESTDGDSNNHSTI